MLKKIKAFSDVTGIDSLNDYKGLQTYSPHVWDTIRVLNG